MTTAIFTKIFGVNEILGKRSATEAWYRKIGLEPARTSIEEAFDNTRYIQQELLQNRGEALLNEKGIKWIYYSASNARSYIEIFEGLSLANQDHLPKNELKQILSIPLIPHDESQEENNRHGRNFIFQFELASYFIKKKIPVLSFDDVEIQFRKRHLWIECKRVHSKKKICDNILGAHDQFHKKKTRYDQKGIIAVSIEKIMDQHNLIHMVESQERLAAIGRSIIEEFAKEAEPAIAKLKRSRIVALMYYLKYTGNIKGTLEMIPSNMYLVHNLRTETVLNYDDWVTVEALIEYCGSVE